MKLKKFNVKVFFVAFCIIVLLTFLSLMGAVMVDQTGESNMYWNLAASVFYIFRYPVEAFVSNTVAGLLLILIINPILYSLLVERLISLKKISPIPIIGNIP